MRWRLHRRSDRRYEPYCLADYGSDKDGTGHKVLKKKWGRMMERNFRAAAALLLAGLLAVTYMAYNQDAAIKAKDKNIAELQKTVNMLKEKEKLEAVVKEQELELAFLKKEKEVQPLASALAYEFAAAVQSGNLDTIEPMLAPKMVVVKEDEKIYLVNDGNLETKFELMTPNEEKVLKEMRYNAYSKVDDSTYFIQIVHYYEDKDGEPITPPTFMNLKLMDDKGKLKVMEVEYDV